MSDIYVRLVPLPSNVKGFVMEDAEGAYNVYLREQDPPEIQRATYQHELAHIQHGDLECECWTEEMETKAEEEAKWPIQRERLALESGESKCMTILTAKGRST